MWVDEEDDSKLARRAALGLVCSSQAGPLHLPVDLFDQVGVPVASVSMLRRGGW